VILAEGPVEHPHGMLDIRGIREGDGHGQGPQVWGIWHIPCHPYKRSRFREVDSASMLRGGRLTSWRASDFAESRKGEARPRKMGLRRGGKVETRGDFVAPVRKAKSPTRTRQPRESSTRQDGWIPAGSLGGGLWPGSLTRC